MSAYLEWLDSKVDPARGISGLRLLWNQHWILVLHTFVIAVIGLVIDWIVSVEVDSLLYYFLLVGLILTPFVTQIYLWVRRAKLWSQTGRVGSRSNG